MNATRKHILFFFSILLICIGGFFLSHSRFSLKQYTRIFKEKRKAADYIQKFDFPVDAPFLHRDISLSNEGLQKIVSQPFFYLAKGKQTEVYVSNDRKYVLRCLTAKKPSKAKKTALLMRRALIAWNEAREETGLLAIGAPNGTIHLPTCLLLTSKGLIVSVPLEKSAFFLQKRADSFKEALLQAHFQKDRKRMEQLLSSLFDLLSSLRDKGIIDLDGALIRNGNIGVVGNKVILLDTGKLEHCHNKREQTKKDINRLRPLHHWLLTLDPNVVPYFLKLQEKYTIVSNDSNEAVSNRLNK